MVATAEIHGTSLSMEEVLQLKAGDLIPLTKRFDAELDLCVDSIPRYMGLVALDPNGKRVFQVTGSRSEG
jgi:flagellar motor switch protein FliM